MTGMEVLVVVVFALIGYWIISAMMDHMASTRSSQRESPHGDKQGANHEFGSGSTGRKEQDGYSANGAAQTGSIHTTWFTILGVSERASREQVTTAYKQKISQYHPDKVAQLGAEIRELAELKSKEINTAYDYAMKLRR